MMILEKLDWILSALEKHIVAFGILIISASVLINIAFRVVGISIYGFDEVAQTTVVWITFIGTGICTRQGIHITMTIVLEKLPLKVKKPVVIAICVISSACCIYLGVLGIQITLAVFLRNQISTVLQIPIWTYYISLPIGFLLSGSYFIRAIMRNIKMDGIYFGIEDGKQEEASR